MTDADESRAPWKPSIDPGVDLRELPLTPEEGFVATRLDGATDLHGLTVVTGLSREKVEAAVEKLVLLGAVTAPPPPAAPPEPAEESQPEETEAAEEEEEEAEPVDEKAGTHRALYESAFHALEGEERVARAKAAEEPDLSALCLDPLPAVVHALLENPRFGPPQARLVATHHRTAAGLDALAARAALAADPGVRRALLRNPVLPVALLRRLLGNRRLIEQHKLIVSRDVPEQTRRGAREVLRTRFATAEAEERVEAIVKTEGRCLASLAGLPIDGKTTALLCGRPYGSTLLVQNISRWAAAPPALIAHLLKQEIVRRAPSLRLMLQRHPNAPSEPRR
ncbi:MAG TPA: hypothetical protein VMK66_09150 [Myxococcales bacterium]|nr:hypothetical protein [Myxococcales bacterium]